MLNDYWPTGGVGSILITSRDPLARGSTFRMTAGHRLLPSNELDAARLLVGLTEIASSSDDSDDGHKEDGVDAVHADALAIARRPSGLPLAITQMAGVINSKRISFDDFLVMYNRDQVLKDLNSLHLGANDTGYKHTLASVWALDELSPGASALLDVISLLDPDRIQEEILTVGATEANRRAYPSDRSNYQDARAELIKSSLITRKVGQQFIKVHRLVQDGARTAMDLERLHRTFDMAVSLLTAIWPFVSIEWRHGTSRWSKCEEYLPHILRLKNFYTDSILETNDFKASLSLRSFSTKLRSWLCIAVKGLILIGILMKNRIQRIVGLFLSWLRQFMRSKMLRISTYSVIYTTVEEQMPPKSTSLTGV